jgi:ubiquinone/menaquinone biosynthesis C-methylase UbiE
MNSPIANKNKKWFQWKLIAFHHKYSQNTRSLILGNIFAEIIQSEINCDKPFEALDFGCGDMKIATCIHQLIPTVNWTGTDVPEKLDHEILPYRYICFKNNKLPFETNQFDVVIMSDVLHHIAEKGQDVAIKECARVGKIVILKDVIEKGIFSRFILLIMDIIGNWAYGVRIPTRYFTKQRFLEFCKKNSLKVEIKVEKVELYNHLPWIVRIMAPPDLHFIAILKKDN